MDRSWMKTSRISNEYQNGVEEFLQFTERNAPCLHGKFFCLCVNCGNGRHQSINDIRSHLICEGIIPTYTKWIWHGELPDMPYVSHTEPLDEDVRHCIEDMIRDLGQDGFLQAYVALYDKIENDSKKPFVFKVHSFHKVVSCVSFGQLEGTIWVE